MKSGFKRLAEQLTENDKVAIISYSGNVSIALEPVSGSENEEIKKAIDKLKAGGSTAGGAAMEIDQDFRELWIFLTITALYQVVPRGRASGSFGDLEFRYKIPGQEQSRLLVHNLDKGREEFPLSSENMRFAASLAGFGMLLENSEYSGDLSFDQVKEWAGSALSFDPYGFREEYIKVIERVQSLD